MRFLTRFAVLAVCAVGAANVAAEEPKDVAADVAAARKELNLNGSSAGYFETNAKARLAAWKAAAEKGSAAAQWLYGRCLDTGAGVEQSEEEAVKWYRKSAEQGFALGQNSLGAMYRDGTGVKEDAAEAAKWFRKAADQKEPMALVNLAKMYDEGNGLKQDAKEAEVLYERASAVGHVPATLLLLGRAEDEKAGGAAAKRLRARAKEQLGDKAEKRIAEYLFGLNPVGKPAPDFTVKVDKKDVSLAAQKGKVVVVAFTAEWCGPCRADAPNRKALAERLKDQPFALILVDVDENRATTGAWGVDSIPRLFVIDPKGVVRETNLRAKDVAKTVDDLLADLKKKP